jgi:hypothetical protein
MELRPWGRVAKAREYLKRIGRTAHVNEILAAIGLTQLQADRSNLACSMNVYVRRGKIFTRPRCNEYGLLADGAPTPERSTGKVALEVTKAMRNRARQKVYRRLASGFGLKTPAVETVYTRPSSCQWCGDTPDTDHRKNAPIEAHHYLGYGTNERDLAVIFVCSTCHKLFEGQPDVVHFIAQKYPDVLWMHDLTQNGRTR